MPAEPLPEPLRLHPGDPSAAGGPAAGPPPGLLLTTDELAELLRVSRRAVERWAAAGRIPGRVQVGRVVRWRRIEVLEWIAAGCPAPARPRRR